MPSCMLEIEARLHLGDQLCKVSLALALAGC
jgi:hypothetical protein